MLHRKCYLPYRKCKLPHRKSKLNGRGAFLSAGLPSPSSLRDATSPKVRGFGCTGTFAFSRKLPLWGSWREAPERARTLAGRLHPGLADANDGADFRKPQSKRTQCAAVSGLALSVIASRCHLSQSERFWMYRKVCLLEKAPPLGELARSA